MKLFSKNSNLCDLKSPTSQTDRRTDRRTDDMRSQYRALHYSASCGKNVSSTWLFSLVNAFVTGDYAYILILITVLVFCVFIWTIVQLFNSLYVDEIIHSQNDSCEVQNLFHQLLTWSNANDLSVRFTKTKEMVMGPPISTMNLPLVRCAEGQIERFSSIKLLCLHLDADLSWCLHVEVADSMKAMKCTWHALHQ